MNDNLWARRGHERHRELYDAEYAKQLERIARIRSEVSAGLPDMAPDEEPPPRDAPPSRDRRRRCTPPPLRTAPPLHARRRWDAPPRTDDAAAQRRAADAAPTTARRATPAPPAPRRPPTRRATPRTSAADARLAPRRRRRPPPRRRGRAAPDGRSARPPRAPRRPRRADRADAAVRAAPRRTTPRRPRRAAPPPRRRRRARRRTDAPPTAPRPRTCAARDAPGRPPLARRSIRRRTARPAAGRDVRPPPTPATGAPTPPAPTRGVSARATRLGGGAWHASRRGPRPNDARHSRRRGAGRPGARAAGARRRWVAAAGPSSSSPPPAASRCSPAATPRRPRRRSSACPASRPGLVVDGGRVWVAGPAAGEVWVLDGRSGRSAAPALRVGGTPARLALDGRFAWIADTERGAVVARAARRPAARCGRSAAGPTSPTSPSPPARSGPRARPTGRSASSTPTGRRQVLHVGARPVALAADERRVVAADAAGALIRLDARSRRPEGPAVSGRRGAERHRARRRPRLDRRRARRHRAASSSLALRHRRPGDRRSAARRSRSPPTRRGVYVLCRGDRTLVELDAEHRRRPLAPAPRRTPPPPWPSIRGTSGSPRETTR